MIRYNLSSQVALNQVEERLYRPQNAYEEQVLTGKERISTDIYPTKEEASKVIADNLSLDIRTRASEGENFVLVISGGQSPTPLLSELVRRHKEEGLSFKNVHIVPMYEFYPLHNSDEGVLAQLREDFIRHIDLPAENVHTYDTEVGKDGIQNSIEKFEQQLDKLGGIDCLIVGLGRRGSIGMNAPGTTLTSENHLAILDSTSRKEAVSTFNTLDNVPDAAITLGVRSVIDSKKVVMLAWGEAKAHTLRNVVEEKYSEMYPASYLQLHRNAQIFTDLQAAEQLTRIKHPWKVTTNMQWTSKLIRRAISWLCQETGKPILKLTNQDYQDHQLGGLLTKYGSAYEVNIKVFNDIQHTITGWPGSR